MIKDRYGRTLNKLRVSLTDRCNYSCFFCMPQSPSFFKDGETLRFEELIRLLRVFRAIGIDEVKLTGGEPLLYPRVVDLVREASGMYRVTMTTNGSLLGRLWRSLVEAGLRGFNVSLHTLRQERHALLGPGSLSGIIKSIDEIVSSGTPVKINTTVIRGFNDDEVLDFVEFSSRHSVPVRFLEYMPFDGRSRWDRGRLVTMEEMLNAIRERYELRPLRREPHSTAIYYEVVGRGAVIGFVPSISAPFCADCNRLRLTSDGKLYPCMYSSYYVDLKEALRRGAGDDEIAELIARGAYNKFEGVVRLIRENALPEHVMPMYRLGG